MRKQELWPRMNTDKRTGRCWNAARVRRRLRTDQRELGAERSSCGKLPGGGNFGSERGRDGRLGELNGAAQELGAGVVVANQVF